MKKTVSAFALITAVALGTIGLTIGSASAHDSNARTTASRSRHLHELRVEPTQSGSNTATVTVNGVSHPFSWTTGTSPPRCPS